MHTINRSISHTETKKNMIRIMLVGDQPIAEEGIHKLISMEDDLEVVATAGPGNELIETVKQINPDIILLDLTMRGGEGLVLLRALQKMKLASRVILFTASEYNRIFTNALQYGCSGILTEDTPPDLVVEVSAK